MFADLDDFECIGAARLANWLADGHDNQIARLHCAGEYQLFLGLAQQLIAVIAAEAHQQREDTLVDADLVARADFGGQRIDRHAAVEARHPQWR